MRIESDIDPDTALHAAIAEASAASRRAIPPESVSTDWANAALARHYGLQGTLTPLAPRPDAHELRFALALADGATRELLVSRPDADFELVDFQSQALLHIARVDPALPVSRLLPSLDGAPWRLQADDYGRQRAVRLQSRLPGTPMAPADSLPGEADASTQARLDLALAGLWHMAGGRELPGDIQRADRIRALLDLVPDDGHRALAAAAIDGFEKRAKPVLPALRRQPIHNDVGVHTVLVDASRPGEVAGVVDFGSMVEAPLVCGLAGTAACQIGANESGGDGEAIHTIARFAAAYHAVSPLQQIDMLVLLDLVRARLAMALAIGSWRIAREPGGSAGISRDTALAGRRLHLLAGCSPSQAHDTIATACMAFAQQATC